MSGPRRFYTGVIQEHYPITSAKKGTPGLEFKVDIDHQKQGDSFEPITPRTETVWLYFPMDKPEAREISLKKLRKAGWAGGGLGDLNLIGSRVELQGYDDEWEGKVREKFDFAFGEFHSPVSEDAGLLIDAIMSAAPVDTSQAAVPAMSGSASKAPPMEDDDVPF